MHSRHQSSFGCIAHGDFLPLCGLPLHPADDFFCYMKASKCYDFSFVKYYLYFLNKNLICNVLTYAPTMHHMFYLLLYKIWSFRFYLDIFYLFGGFFCAGWKFHFSTFHISNFPTIICGRFHLLVHVYFGCLYQNSSTCNYMGLVLLLLFIPLYMYLSLCYMSSLAKPPALFLFSVFVWLSQVFCDFIYILRHFFYLCEE